MAIKTNNPNNTFDFMILKDIDLQLRLQELN